MGVERTHYKNVTIADDVTFNMQQILLELI